MNLPKLDELKINEIPQFSTPISWGINNVERFNQLMAEVKTLVTPGYYLGDNLFTWGRNLSLFSDEPFKRAWQQNITNPADEAIAWRRYILTCAAHHCIQLDGDFVECGVYNGTGIKTVIDYLGAENFPKTFWGYDTYDYNPVEGHKFSGQEEGLYDRVKARFANYPTVKLIKGFIPDSFADGIPQKIAYLHIDLNNAEGELATLEALFDRVVPGGMVILDDYEWAGVYRNQKHKEDPWFEQRGYRIFPLPTGQGFIIRR